MHDFQVFNRCVKIQIPAIRLAPVSDESAICFFLFSRKAAKSAKNGLKTLRLGTKIGCYWSKSDKQNQNFSRGRSRETGLFLFKKKVLRPMRRFRHFSAPLFFFVGMKLANSAGNYSAGN
ncbi:MAG: hypothetical protein ACQERN_08995 [Thermodesulfobacteriota bacterium]